MLACFLVTLLSLIALTPLLFVRPGLPLALTLGKAFLGIEVAARWHGREYFSSPQEKTLAEPGALEGG